MFYYNHGVTPIIKTQTPKKKLPQSKNDSPKSIEISKVKAVIIISRTSFRVNRHSIVFLKVKELEAGTISEV